MRIQPVQGSGMNAGYDAATKSITISNEGNTPFLYFRVNSKIPKDNQDYSKGIYTFYDFYEVIWDGENFSKLEGGLSATYDSRETCPKLYAVPYDIDDPSNIGNFTGNLGVSGQGLVFVGRYRGVDSTDGRDVYEFFRSLDPSSKVLVKIDDTTSFIQGYYPAISTGNLQLDQTTPYQNKYWVKELNGAELTIGRNYIGFFVGESFDPYKGDPENSDNRPVLTVINTVMAGTTGVTIVTDIVCVGGAVSPVYGTFYPSEEAYITQDTKKTFISLNDTPSSYQNAANYFLCVNQSGTGISFTTANPPSTFVPNLSFINLKDCPTSYPSSPEYGQYMMVINPGQNPTVSFQLVNIIQNKFSIVPSSGTLNSGFHFKLVNDKQTPGKNMYYGTDEEGVKGWYEFPQQ